MESTTRRTRVPSVRRQRLRTAALEAQVPVGERRILALCIGLTAAGCGDSGGARMDSSTPPDEGLAGSDGSTEVGADIAAARLTDGTRT